MSQCSPVPRSFCCKLNVQYTIIALKKYKYSFDKILLQVMQGYDLLSQNILKEVTKIVFAQFPQLGSTKIEFLSDTISDNFKK